MSQPLLLLCKYGMLTAVIHLSRGMSYDGLMSQVCNRWRNLTMNMVCFTYALPGHPKCLLDSDSDLMSLSMLASSMGLGTVDVFVTESQGSEDDDQEEIGDHLDEDALPLVGYEDTDIGEDVVVFRLGKWY